MDSFGGLGFSLFSDPKQVRQIGICGETAAIWAGLKPWCLKARGERSKLSNTDAC